jgi:hypothetical protein
MVNSLKTGNSLEESDCDLIKVLSEYFPGGTKENHENPQDSRCPGRGLDVAPLGYESSERYRFPNSFGESSVASLHVNQLSSNFLKQTPCSPQRL